MGIIFILILQIGKPRYRGLFSYLSQATWCSSPQDLNPSSQAPRARTLVIAPGEELVGLNCALVLFTLPALQDLL